MYRGQNGGRKKRTAKEIFKMSEVASRGKISAPQDNEEEMPGSHHQNYDNNMQIMCCGKPYLVKVTVTLTDHKTVSVKASKPKLLSFKPNNMSAHNPQSKLGFSNDDNDSK